MLICTECGDIITSDNVSTYEMLCVECAERLRLQWERIQEEDNR